VGDSGFVAHRGRTRAGPRPDLTLSRTMPESACWVGVAKDC